MRGGSAPRSRQDGAFKPPSPGTRGVPWDRQHHPHAGRQLPWHPQGSTRAQGAAPRQPPTSHGGVPTPHDDTGGTVPSWVTAQRAYVLAQVGAQRGTEMERARKLLPWGHPGVPGTPSL